jgi:adenosylcobyric acid synthase
MHERTGRPVLGVLPFDPAVQLDEEDSLGIAAPVSGAAEIDIAVLRLPGISNFTDFAVLARLPGVSVRFVADSAELHRPNLIVLPGTRTTVRALAWLHATGWAQTLQKLAADSAGPYIVGICGGCQLLGHTIADPDGVESDQPNAEGLGLLDLDTRFAKPKTLARVEGEVIEGLCQGCKVVGYEVHQGVSTRRPGARPWLRLTAGEDGAVNPNGRVYGSYVHGLFDDARFGRALINALRERRGLALLSDDAWLSQRDFWAQRYQRLGSWLAEHCDLAPVATALGLEGS